MVHGAKNIEEKAILLPLTQAALRTARQFADQQPTPEKKEQVYLNTLAVFVVNDYMEIMDIPTNLGASDSWNPAMRLYTDVADLKLTQLGHLECRPIQFGTCYIPPEVPEDRIGVVVVEISVEHQEATLLGFAKTVRTGELSINQLQTVDDLLEHLDSFERNYAINLSGWLQDIFEAAWQSAEEVLAPIAPLPAFRYNSRVTRAKLIDLGIQLPGQMVALVVTLTPKTSVEIDIRLQVYPNGEQTHLPDNLTVQVLDGKGAVVMEAHTRTANTHIKLEFSVQLEERFSVRLELGDMSFTEYFVV